MDIYLEKDTHVMNAQSINKQKDDVLVPLGRGTKWPDNGGPTFWNHYTVSKYSTPFIQWCCTTSHKNRDNNYTTVNAYKLRKMKCVMCGNDTKPTNTHGYNQCMAHYDKETEWQPVTFYNAGHESEQIMFPSYNRLHNFKQLLTLHFHHYQNDPQRLWIFACVEQPSWANHL